MSYNLVGIKDSANLFIRYKADVGTHKKGDIFAYSNYAKTSTNEWTSDSVYAKSKDVNAIRWDYNRGSTLKISMETFTLDWIALAGGAEINDLSAENNKSIIKRQVATVPSATTYTVTIADTPVTSSVTVYYLNEDGVTQGKKFESATAGSEAAGTYSIATTTLTFAAADAGKVVAIYYMESQTVGREFTINADKFPGNFEVFADAMIRNTNSTDSFCQIHYFNLKPKANFTLTMDAENITTLEIEFDIFKNSDGSGDMAEYTII